MLVNHGIDLNVKDNNGQTVLYYAAASGNLPMCQLLVSNGCNIASTDKSREKAINYARKKGHGHIVDFLNNYRPETKKIPKI
jgi:serine/threonine-protein phosphatase 6 regulatory ankyrin repeat subunit B